MGKLLKCCKSSICSSVIISLLLPFSEREKRRGKRGKRSGGTLSFAMEDEEEEEDGRESDKEACELNLQ